MGSVITVLTGLAEKAPAAFLLETNGRRLLLDFGVDDEGRHADLSTVGPLDAIVISHGHADHVDGLQSLDPTGAPPVYATPMLAADLPAGLERRSMPVAGTFDLFGMKVTVGPTGHAPDGVWLHFGIDGGILYMGDHSDESDVFAFATPPAAETVIIDASYATDSEPRAPQMADILGLARQGPLLLPAPPRGRNAELAVAGIAAGLDVAIDAATRSIMRRTLETGAPPLKPAAVAAVERTLREARTLDAASEPQGLMIAGAASCGSGVAGALVERWAADDMPNIVLTGYTPASTRAAKLLASGRATYRRWNVHPTLAENTALIRKLGARRVVPAFADPRHWPDLAAAWAPSKLETSGRFTV